MPYFNKELNELVYNAAESDPFDCPVCGAQLSFGDCDILDNEELVRSRWTCSECDAVGCAFDKLVFCGHRVEIATVSPEMRKEHIAVKTMCINGPLSVGDLVLSTIDCDGFPCLPGRVTEIRLLGSEEHDTGNESDDVVVDFRSFYGKERQLEIIKANNNTPYCMVRLEDIIMAPGFLININGIGKKELEAVTDNAEQALRYAYRVVRDMLPLSASAA